MKKMISIAGSIILMLSMLTLVMAEEATVGGGVVVNTTGSCSPPEIFVDPTARIWNPNDQTWYTTLIYGENVTNAYNYTGKEISERQNYVFQGETLQYFVMVYDEDGADDIDDVNLKVDGAQVGACAQRSLSAIIGLVGVPYLNTHLGLDPALSGATFANYAFYACTLIVQSASSWNESMAVKVVAIDGETDACEGHATPVESRWSDWLDFNPTLELSFIGGPVNFGTVEAGSTATSNTIYVSNNAEAGSGVVMDMYIASDDYFTDPTTPGAICPVSNGIHYSQFSYYATKGSLNSGPNDNTFPALGELPPLCIANPDEYTNMTSHSGHIEDMCHIINWDDDGNSTTPNSNSLLTQGAEMSVTFQLDVPDPCFGSFSDGQFHFVGRVV
ncbi:MAG: hypothetical protein V1740_05395 [Candidatus Woesearchaeota archaeon]